MAHVETLAAPAGLPSSQGQWSSYRFRAVGSVAEQQLELLRRMAELDPAPCIFGGYAEDALLAGTVTRPHEDVDWLLPRREFELRR
jgi:hypothetical protein